ncbi:hypothetical protein, partial [Streptomyces sp. NPDC059460]|uniref:hypothetical protein n=1 Tax=Streptomyces sp. NPDC059460 TaxID=3346840 RepID=UPI00369CBB0E
SREDESKERRVQASRVNAWGEKQAGADDVLVTANRSLDPVVAWTFLNDAARRDVRSKEVTYVYFGVVPPCTAVRIPKSVLYSRASERHPGPDTGWKVRGLHFATSEGTMWVRWNAGGGLLMETNDRPAAIRPDDLGLVADRQAKITPLTECGATK